MHAALLPPTIMVGVGQSGAAAVSLAYTISGGGITPGTLLLVPVFGAGADEAIIVSGGPLPGPTGWMA